MLKLKNVNISIIIHIALIFFSLVLLSKKNLVLDINNNLLKGFQDKSKEDKSDKKSRGSNRSLTKDDKLKDKKVKLPESTIEILESEDAKDNFLDQIEEWLATDNPSNYWLIQ